MIENIIFLKTRIPLYLFGQDCMQGLLMKCVMSHDPETMFNCWVKEGLIYVHSSLANSQEGDGKGKSFCGGH